GGGGGDESGKGLGGAGADGVGEGASLTLRHPAIQVDALMFERLLRQSAVESLEAAMMLYRGDLLEGLAVKEAPFDEWLLIERERLRELALEAVARLLARQVKAGTDAVAIQTGLRLLALDPLQEGGPRAPMPLSVRQ